MSKFGKTISKLNRSPPGAEGKTADVLLPDYHNYTELISELEELADLTKATLVPPWPPDTTTMDTVVPRHPGGTLTRPPPVMTSTTEDTPSIPKDPGPTRVRDHRPGRLLLLPVQQELRLLPYLNLTISTRYGLQLCSHLILILCVCVGFFALLV